MKGSILKEYKELLTGVRRRFSSDFWKECKTKDDASLLIRYLFNEHLKTDKRFIIARTSFPFFSQYNLGSVIARIFDSSYINAVLYSFPDIHRWELGAVPKTYWNKYTVSTAVKWLVEEELKYKVPEQLNSLTVLDFKRRRLHPILLNYNNDMSSLLKMVYPNYVVNTIYDSPNEESINKLKEIIEVELQWTDSDIINYLSRDILIQNGFTNKFMKTCGCNMFNIINLVYPNRFKPWQFRGLSSKYWDDLENCKDAMVWILNKYNYTEDDIKSKVTVKLLRDNNLSIMLSKCGGKNKLLKILYPNRF